MICPKCGHQGKNAELCEVCGIVFAKFAKRQEQSAEQNPVGQAQRQRKSSSTILLLCLVAVIGIAAGKFLFSNPVPSDMEVPSPSATPAAIKSAEPVPATSPPIKHVQTTKPLAKQQQQYTETTIQTDTDRSSLDRARNATVLIESSWGLGSGVLIDGGGHIVTNRHVVEYGRKQLDEVNAQLERLEEYIKVEENTLKTFKKDLDKNKNHALWESYNYKYQQRKEMLNKYKKDYDSYTAKRNQILYSSVDPRVDVTFLSGEKVTVWDIALSDNHDLALLSVKQELDTQIQPIIAKKDGFRQGDRVYTIGNPSGLRHTMTSGIISGFRQYTNPQSKVTRLIQTDAPINSGNSGGPLVDEEGRVIGINTVVLKDTEGIGFALPISLVWEEFAPELNDY